jgi:hypothetical protein
MLTILEEMVAISVRSYKESLDVDYKVAAQNLKEKLAEFMRSYKQIAKDYCLSDEIEIPFFNLIDNDNTEYLRELMKYLKQNCLEEFNKKTGLSCEIYNKEEGEDKILHVTIKWKSFKG